MPLNLLLHFRVENPPDFAKFLSCTTQSRASIVLNASDWFSCATKTLVCLASAQELRMKRKTRGGPNCELPRRMSERKEQDKVLDRLPPTASAFDDRHREGLA